MTVAAGKNFQSADLSFGFAPHLDLIVLKHSVDESDMAYRAL
jgi:hypothetical protein